jgi:uncharacterized membrane protein YraQ (UPF0718 family)
MIESLATYIVYDLLNLSSGAHLSEALHFFIYDTIKIFLLLAVITHLMGLVNSYFPVERIRDFLSRRNLFGLQYLIASLFGALTPFCSCSSIPLFLGFLQGGLPLGVTFAFLITSPLVNEVAVALFIAAFGWKVTLIYAGSGILLGTILGMILGRFRLERFLEDWVKKFLESNTSAAEAEKRQLTFKERVIESSTEARGIIKGITLYVVIGVGVGAALHGYVPENFFEQYLKSENVWSVPLAVIVGVPLYANASAIVPVMQTLVAKGVPIGTALAFMMAAVGLSFPEAMMLKKAMKPTLLAIFFGSVASAIILLGYVFNIIL